MALRRILGALMLVVGLLALMLCVPGVIYGHQLVDGMAQGLDATLDSTAQSLLTVKDTLLLAKTTISQIDDGLDTVKMATLDLSSAIDDSQPLLEEIAGVVSEDVPNGLDAVQAAVPDMAHAAEVIEQTLTALSNLELTQSFLGLPLRFSLGIEYTEDTPMADSVNAIGESLDGVAPRLRALETHLDSAGSSLETINKDVLAAVNDLDAISDSLATVPALLDDYLGVVAEISVVIDQTRASVTAQLATAKIVVTLVMVWIGLAQLAPLYLGWELATNSGGGSQRPGGKAEEVGG
jgi:hypothetical protein